MLSMNKSVLNWTCVCVFTSLNLIVRNNRKSFIKLVQVPHDGCPVWQKHHPVDLFYLLSFIYTNKVFGKYICDFVIQLCHPLLAMASLCHMTPIEMILFAWHHPRWPGQVEGDNCIAKSQMHLAKTLLVQMNLK